jgi:hypothetical protein
MKASKYLGVVIVAIVVLILLGRTIGLVSFYDVYPRMVRPPSGAEFTAQKCYGKNITISDKRAIDGSAKFLCIGNLKTETQISY